MKSEGRVRKDASRGKSGRPRRTHGSDDLGVSKIVDDDLGHLGEVPSVPLLREKERKGGRIRTGLDEPKLTRESYLNSHGVDVDLLVKIVKEGNSLDDHGVNLVGRELELESETAEGKWSRASA